MERYSNKACPINANSQLIHFVRALHIICSNVSDFNKENQFLTAKLL